MSDHPPIEFESAKRMVSRAHMAGYLIGINDCAKVARNALNECITGDDGIIHCDEAVWSDFVSLLAYGLLELKKNAREK